MTAASMGQMALPANTKLVFSATAGRLASDGHALDNHSSFTSALLLHLFQHGVSASQAIDNACVQVALWGEQCPIPFQVSSCGPSSGGQPTATASLCSMARARTCCQAFLSGTCCVSTASSSRGCARRQSASADWVSFSTCSTLPSATALLRSATLPAPSTTGAFCPFQPTAFATCAEHWRRWPTRMRA